MDNRVQLYMRKNSPHWQCSCSVAGRQRRTTTREESLARAKDVARDWYLSLLGKYRSGELKEGKTFREAAERFIDEFETITEGQRSAVYVACHKDRINNHLNPFFGNLVLSDITAGKVQDYRIHRMKTGMSRKDQHKLAAHIRKNGSSKGFERQKPPSRSTLHQEIVCLRQILKTANRQGWLDHLPNLSAPYKSSSKVSHRAWFSAEEYKQLYTATGMRAKNPPKPRWKWSCEQLHDFVLFMANTGLRPDEALRLQFRDVEIESGTAGNGRDDILVITVRGKRGVGYCKSMPGAVEPFRRLEKRPRPVKMSESLRSSSSSGASNEEPSKTMVPPKPTDLVFPKTHRQLFRDILNELDLKTDREGNERTAYSLRHTYISLRLMEGADIYQIAKNCRTSVEMIEKYYASHIKDSIDAGAINVRKPRPRTPPPKAR
ncbi:MAG: site-specific integrase [Gammaproteobacteria bacterium]|nr:site-specific integrase [Gammaproteobacteria bacterium]